MANFDTSNCDTVDLQWIDFIIQRLRKLQAVSSDTVAVETDVADM